MIHGQSAGWRTICFVLAMVLFMIAAVTAFAAPEPPAPNRWYRTLVASGLFFWALSNS